MTGTGRRKRVLLSWSSGKDAAWALHVLRANPDVEVHALLTTINSRFRRVAMHGVRRDLVELQALAVGLPLVAVPLDWPCTNEDYETALLDALGRARADFQIDHVAFGDLHLEDVRAYRERQNGRIGLGSLFPIWGMPTERLAADMVRSGLRAWITCLDPNKLDRGSAGRPFDAKFLASLPDGVDACGENGEFHTFVSDGPMFSEAVDVRPGEVVERDGFVFADVLPRG